MKRTGGNIYLGVLIFIASLVSIFLYLKYFRNSDASPLPAKSLILKPSPSVGQTPKPTPVKYPLFDVPFTAQAPFGDWADPHQQDGCEEASALMAVSWARGQSFTLSEALRQILAASKYEEKTYGSYHDTSADDTVARIYIGYFQFDQAKVVHNVGKEDIKRELLKENLVVVPMNGQKLHNPYYVQPGPIRHMLVVKGYDPNKKEFITNDPGTRHGQSYRYNEDIFEKAILDYVTGFEEPIIEGRTAMIVVSR